MRLLSTLALAATLLASASPARADALTGAEQGRLVRGEAVTRRQTLEQGGRRYVGGVTYQVVDATPRDCAALLGDVRTWRRILPHTRDARRVDAAPGGDPRVEVTHGSALLQVAYTLDTRPEQDGGLRFWLDRRRPHDIEDAWGFLRATPLPDGRTLLTWGILIDMGPGLLRDLFEPRVQELALTVPDRIRDVIAERSARGRAASR